MGRVSAGLVALTFAGVATAAPGWLGIAAAAFLVDYGGRSFTRSLGSPITWAAGLALDALRVPPEPVPVVPMRWSVAVGAVLFSFVLALVEGNFMLPARVLALLMVPVTGAYAFAGFCTVGTIYSRISNRAGGR